MRFRAQRQVVQIAAALALYMVLRVIVEGSSHVAHSNAHDVLAFERWLGLDWERGAQAWVLDNPGWITAANWVYVWLYWPSVALGLVVLFYTNHRQYLRLRNALFVAAAIGIVIFAAFPVSPPRFLDGYTDTLQLRGQRLTGTEPSFANVYAAVPSFHVGWPALAGFVVGATFRRRWVWAVSLTPAVLIAGAVVLTGNHYVIDGFIGVAVVAVAYRAALLIERLTHPRRDTAVEAPAQLPPPARGPSHHRLAS